MKVKELIEQLSECKQDLDVYIYIEGARYPVQMVDDCLTDLIVDINAETEE